MMEETVDSLTYLVLALQRRLAKDGLTLVRIRTNEELRQWLQMERLGVWEVP